MVQGQPYNAAFSNISRPLHVSSHSLPDHNEDDADVDVPTPHWPGESDLHLIKKDLETKKKKTLFSFQK